MRFLINHEGGHGWGLYHDGKCSLLGTLFWQSLFIAGAYTMTIIVHCWGLYHGDHCSLLGPIPWRSVFIAGAYTMTIIVHCWGLYHDDHCSLLGPIPWRSVFIAGAYTMTSSVHCWGIYHDDHCSCRSMHWLTVFASLSRKLLPSARHNGSVKHSEQSIKPPKRPNHANINKLIINCLQECWIQVIFSNWVLPFGSWFPELFLVCTILLRWAPIFQRKVYSCEVLLPEAFGYCPGGVLEFITGG